MKIGRCFISILLLLSLAALPAEAATTDLELRGEASGLVLVPAGGNLFNLGNMSPGDTRTARITIMNNYSRWYDLWMKAENLRDAEPGLLEILELTVHLDGKLLAHEQPLAEFPDGTIYLGRFQPGRSEEMVATVHLPGPETGNEYGGITARLNWVFIARRSGGSGGGGGSEDYWDWDEPESLPSRGPTSTGSRTETESGGSPGAPGLKPAMPKTGQGAPTLYYVLGALALAAGVGLTRKPGRGRH